MQSLPKDPVILLSYLNTQLRDFYPSLKEFCAANNVEEKEITQKLSSINYTYDSVQNQFI